MPHEMTQVVHWRCLSRFSQLGAAGWDVARLIMHSAVWSSVSGHIGMGIVFWAASSSLAASARAWSTSITSPYPSSPLAMNFLWSKELQEEVQKLNCKTYWALKKIFKRLQFKVVSLEHISIQADDASALLDMIK